MDISAWEEVRDGHDDASQTCTAHSYGCPKWTFLHLDHKWHHKEEEDLANLISCKRPITHYEQESHLYESRHDLNQNCFLLLAPFPGMTERRFSDKYQPKAIKRDAWFFKITSITILVVIIQIIC